MSGALELTRNSPEFRLQFRVFPGHIAGKITPCNK